MERYPKEFLRLLHSVKARRAHVVIMHILEHGHITTEELKNLYGYNHPPRAARDVREYGIPLVTYRVEAEDGRRIGAYRFGDPHEIGRALSRISGRMAFSRKLKRKLIGKHGAKCSIYLETMDQSLLQVDHRVPYEIGGESGEHNIDDFMLLSPSANRAKSWACEHCDNWLRKDMGFCRSYFWAFPENYDHVAGRKEKVVVMLFSEEEIEDYNKLAELAGKDSVADTAKKMLHLHLCHVASPFAK